MAYIWRGDLTEGFLRYEFGGLIFGILRYTIVSHVTRPVLCWSAVGANSKVALQSETILIGNAWSFSSVISS